MRVAIASAPWRRFQDRFIGDRRFYQTVLRLKRVISVIVVSLLAVGLLVGCIDQAANRELEDEVAGWRKLSQSHEPLLSALRAIELIKAKDWESLAVMVHPEAGVRFTAYPYIELEEDQVFTAEQVAGLATNTTEYDWGRFDGSGDPIRLTVGDYYKRFIYDADFAQAPVIGRDHIIGLGNAIDNVKEAYPDGRFVEFHFPGTKQHDGIDWRSLKLVFEQQGETWHLVGIIHGEWTI